MVLPFTVMMLLLVLAQAPAPCPSGQSEPMFSEILTDAPTMDAFIVKLQKAVAASDKPTVASMVRFPISAWAGKREMRLRNAAALIASYDQVFTTAVKRAIAGARTPCLFTNSQGAMINNGEIWIRPSPDGDLQIITINNAAPKD